MSRDAFEEEALTMIEDCENRESKLSDWETNFIDSIKGQIEQGHSLTEKQRERLETIWERVT